MVKLTEGKQRLARLREEELSYNVWNTSYKINFNHGLHLIPVVATPVNEKERIAAGERKNSPLKKAPVNPITHVPILINVVKQ